MDKVFPRRGLNTIRKHVEELLSIQSAYVQAMQTCGPIILQGTSDEESCLGTTGTEELLDRMDELDGELEQVLDEADIDRTAKWFERG